MHSDIPPSSCRVVSVRWQISPTTITSASSSAHAYKTRNRSAPSVEVSPPCVPSKTEIPTRGPSKTTASLRPHSPRWHSCKTSGSFLSYWRILLRRMRPRIALVRTIACMWWSIDMLSQGRTTCPPCLLCRMLFCCRMPDRGNLSEAMGEALERFGGSLWWDCFNGIGWRVGWSPMHGRNCGHFWMIAFDEHKTNRIIGFPNRYIHILLFW